MKPGPELFIRIAWKLSRNSYKIFDKYLVGMATISEILGDQ